MSSTNTIDVMETMPEILLHPVFEMKAPLGPIVSDSDIPTQDELQDPFVGWSECPSDGRWYPDQQDLVLDLMDNIHNEWDFSDLAPSQYDVRQEPGSPSSFLPALTADTDQITEQLDPTVQTRDMPPAVPSLTHTHTLRRTIVFISILVFVKDSEHFFYTISGCGATAGNAKIGVTDIQDQSKFIGDLHAEFLPKLKKYGSTMSIFVLACHSVVETCAAWGLLGSLPDVKGFLINFARVSYLIEMGTNNLANL
jgi:hypothetical protein